MKACRRCPRPDRCSHGVRVRCVARACAICRVAPPLRARARAILSWCAPEVTTRAPTPCLAQSDTIAGGYTRTQESQRLSFAVNKYDDKKTALMVAVLFLFDVEYVVKI